MVDHDDGNATSVHPQKLPIGAIVSPCRRRLQAGEGVLAARTSFTGLLSGVPWYVASRTLVGPLGWQGSKLVTGDVAGSVTAFKDRHEEVHVIGSLDLVQSLLCFGLVDRLNCGCSAAARQWQTVVRRRYRAHGAAPDRIGQAPSGTLHLAYETAGAPTYGTLAQRAGLTPRRRGRRRR